MFYYAGIGFSIRSNRVKFVELSAQGVWKQQRVLHFCAQAQHHHIKFVELSSHRVWKQQRLQHFCSQAQQHHIKFVELSSHRVWEQQRVQHLCSEAQEHGDPRGLVHAGRRQRLLATGLGYAESIRNYADSNGNECEHLRGNHYKSRRRSKTSIRK